MDFSALSPEGALQVHSAPTSRAHIVATTGVARRRAIALVPRCNSMQHTCTAAVLRYVLCCLMSVRSAPRLCFSWGSILNKIPNHKCLAHRCENHLMGLWAHSSLRVSKEVGRWPKMLHNKCYSSCFLLNSFFHHIHPH